VNKYSNNPLYKLLVIRGSVTIMVLSEECEDNTMIKRKKIKGQKRYRKHYTEN